MGVNGWGNTHGEQGNAMSDVDLMAAYERTNGELGNPKAEALLAAIQRRDLNA